MNPTFDSRSASRLDLSWGPASGSQATYADAASPKLSSMAGWPVKSATMEPDSEDDSEQRQNPSSHERTVRIDQGEMGLDSIWLLEALIKPPKNVGTEPGASLAQQERGQAAKKTKPPQDRAAKGSKGFGSTGGVANKREISGESRKVGVRAGDDGATRTANEQESQREDVDEDDEDVFPDSPLPGLVITVGDMEIEIGKQIFEGKDMDTPAVLHMGKMTSTNAQVVLKIACTQPYIFGLNDTSLSGDRSLTDVEGSGHRSESYGTLIAAGGEHRNSCFSIEGGVPEGGSRTVSQHLREDSSVTMPHIRGSNGTDIENSRELDRRLNGSHIAGGSDEDKVGTWQLFRSDKERIQATEAGEREASLLGMMQNTTRESNTEYVVRLFASGCAQVLRHDVFVQVLEYAEGGTLHDHVVREMRERQEYGLQLQETKRIFKSIVEGVSAMHAIRLAHRDVKPANILMMAKDEAGECCLQPKLGDFGLAIEVPDMPRRTTFKHFQAGTYQFMPPEVYAGATWNSKGAVGKFSMDAVGDPYQADVWACGVTLYFMAHGYTPFPDERINGEKRVAEANFLVREQLPKDLRDLIRGTMAMPEDRLTLEEVLNHPYLQ